MDWVYSKTSYPYWIEYILKLVIADTLPDDQQYSICIYKTACALITHWNYNNIITKKYMLQICKNKKCSVELPWLMFTKAWFNLAFTEKTNFPIGERENFREKNVTWHWYSHHGMSGKCRSVVSRGLIPNPIKFRSWIHRTYQKRGSNPRSKFNF